MYVWYILKYYGYNLSQNYGGYGGHDRGEEAVEAGATMIEVKRLEQPW